MVSIMNTFWSETFSEVFKTLLYIDGVIYRFIGTVFGLIIDLASANFITTDIVDMLLDRIYIIVGVLALFLITYALIKSLFDPNNAFKGKKSAVNVIKNMMIAIALTVLMPTIFSYLYRFQSIIIDSNVISAIILGSGSSADGVQLCVRDPGNVSEDFLPKTAKITCGDGFKLLNFNAENSGYSNFIKMSAQEMSFTALNTFLFAEDDFATLDNKAGAVEWVFGTVTFSYRFMSNPIGTTISSIQNLYNDLNDITFADVKYQAIANNNFMYISNLARAVSFGNGAEVGTGEVTYYMFLSTICGIALLCLAIVTCVNLALRILKLFALEILSPIACFSMVIPDSKIFDRWLKETIMTYLDLFFRLITFNLCILLFGQIHGITESFEGRTGLLLDLFIIAGLLIFINEAPKMIKDILGIKTNDQKLLKRMFGGTVGSVLSGGAGFLGGLVGGATGASRALSDSTPNLKTWSKVRNAGLSAMSGVGIGKNAAKAKNFGDWKNTIDSGIQNSVKANQLRNLKDARNGSFFSKEGIMNRASNAIDYFTGVSGIHALDNYNSQETRLAAIKDGITKINEIADADASVAAKNNKFEAFKKSKQSRELFLKNEQDRVQNILTDMRARGDTKSPLYSQYQNYFNGLATNDKTIQDAAFKNYCIQFENELNKLETDYKIEKSNFVNEQAKDSGSKVSAQIGIVKGAFERERAANNIFLSSASKFDFNKIENDNIYHDASGNIIQNTDGFLNDLKDAIFGKSSIANTNEMVFDITNLSQADIDKLRDAGIQFVNTDSVKKKFDEKQGKYVDVNNMFDKLASVYKKQHNIDVDNIINTFVKNNPNVDVSTLKQDFVNKIQTYYKERFDNKGVVSSSTANDLARAFSSLGLNNTSINFSDFVNEFKNVRSGIERNEKGGSIEEIHRSPEYIDASKKHNMAYDDDKKDK